MSPKTLAKVFLTFLFFAALTPASLLYADQLININTADKTTLMTLSGLGGTGTKAQAVIDYRTQNGPFAKIEDIMNVSGIGQSTFNNIKAFITVDGSSQTQAATSTPVQTQSQTSTQTSLSVAPSAGPPPPLVNIMTDSRPMVGGGSYFSATAYAADDTPLSGVRFMWSFGDGGAAEGARVFHTYAYPGKYAVSVSAAYNYSASSARTVVEAVSAAVSLEAEGDGSLLIRNNSSSDIAIGLWSLSDGGKSYGVPEGTILLAGEGVRFAATLTGLAGTPSAVLLYPNNAPAAAASVAPTSPLRGQRVSKEELGAASTPSKTKQAQSEAATNPDTGEVLGDSTSVASTSSGSVALWGSAAALAGLLVAGGAAAYYLPRLRQRDETSASAEEFDIE